MRLLEHEAKRIFEENGLKVPKRKVIEDLKQAEGVLSELNLPVAVKAQVLVGGRGKAGGIKFAETQKELKRKVEEILNLEIKGHTPDKVLIEEKLDIKKEMYCGVTIDRSSGHPVIIVSSEGGIDIEEIAEKSPDKIKKDEVNTLEGFFGFDAINLARKLGCQREELKKFSKIILKIYRIFEAYDCKIVEVNPLVKTNDSDFICADAVLQIDDSALYKHTKFREKKLNNMPDTEKSLYRKGATFVELEGNIGLICSGAGLGMATMDLMKNHENLSPANFLETGGGITDELMYNCMKMIIERLEIDGLLINLYGGINPIHEGARGVVKAIEDYNLDIPVVAKALGNKQELTWERLRQAEVEVVKEFETRKAVEKLAQSLGEV